MSPSPFGPDDRVGVWLPVAQLAEAFERVVARGAVAVPLALRLSAVPLAYHLRDAGASCLVTDASHEAVAREAMRLAPRCGSLVLREALSPAPSLVVAPDASAAFFSYAPETRGGRPRGAVHDRIAARLAVDGIGEALDLGADDEVAIEIPLWEGALALALAARAVGAHIVERARGSTTVVAVRTRDAVARLSELASERAVLRGAVAVGSGSLGEGIARSLAERHPTIELAAARVIRELPLWLTLDVLARGRSATRRLREGSLRGVESREHAGGRLAVRGEAVPRAYHEAEDETHARIVDGWLVSEDPAPASVVATKVAGDRAALDVLDAQLTPREPSPSHLARARARTIVYPLGRGRGASLALAAGLKPMLRELIGVDELEHARARFDAAGFAVEVAPLVFGPTHDGWLGRPESRTGTARRRELDRQPIYVGRDREALRRAIACEEAMTLDGARELGELLGYPSCCVEAFIAHADDRRAVRLLASAATRTPREAFRARLNVVDPSTFTFISWFPCRFDCVPSVALADALAELVAQTQPDFVRAIDDALGAPRLVLAPEIQLRLAQGSAGLAVSSTRSHADPRAVDDPRELSIAARALALLEHARTIDVREGALLLDGEPAPIRFDAPLPLLLPFAP